MFFTIRPMQNSLLIYVLACKQVGFQHHFCIQYDYIEAKNLRVIHTPKIFPHALPHSLHLLPHIWFLQQQQQQKKSSVKTSNSQVVAAPLKLLPNTKLVEENDSLKKLCTFMLQHNKVSCLQFSKCLIKNFTVCLLINFLKQIANLASFLSKLGFFGPVFFSFKEISLFCKNAQFLHNYCWKKGQFQHF